MEKNFKVTYGKAPRTNKWGYFLPKDQQPPTYEKLFDTLDEAKEFASKVHTKKVNVQIYDCEGPGDEDSASHIWLIGSWDKNIYYPNDNYGF